ncbi:MAG: hypothetical protein AAF593_09135 [Planctomycetota bacterium]
MKHLDLLGAELKSDFLCDLFETHDVRVIYQYDRNHEGATDEYLAAIPELGLEFIFDARQTLRTIFVTLIEIRTFNPFDALADSCHVFESKNNAKQFAISNGVKQKEGHAEFLGELRDWIRFDYPDYSIHYEFRNQQLGQITLSAK